VLGWIGPSSIALDRMESLIAVRSGLCNGAVGRKSPILAVFAGIFELTGLLKRR
jgi:hypothetical protein